MDIRRRGPLSSETTRTELAGVASASYSCNLPSPRHSGSRANWAVRLGWHVTSWRHRVDRQMQPCSSWVADGVTANSRCCPGSHSGIGHGNRLRARSVIAMSNTYRTMFGPQNRCTGLRPPTASSIRWSASKAAIRRRLVSIVTRSILTCRLPYSCQLDHGVDSW